MAEGNAADIDGAADSIVRRLTAAGYDREATRELADHLSEEGLAETVRSGQEDGGREGERDESPSVLGLLSALAQDLGIGFGLSGLYFTAFLALWKGRTPGKRLFRIEVVRLSGDRIGWWASFSRFGGYAAGLATGLLGFLQIFWDANRQGIHDRIAGTVVVRAEEPTVARGRRDA